LEEVEKVVAVEKVDVPKKETQILDEIEIAKIKGILTEETSDELVLEELMTPVASTMLLDDTSRSEADKGKEKPEFKEKDIHDEAIVQTLASMPVESLRELLAGAVVKIKIKFPKSK
jgi:hypothetical protein